MRLNNNKGSALIVAYFVMSVLVTLSAAFSLYTFNEVNNAKRFRDSTSAFWLAEAGISEYRATPSILENAEEYLLTYEKGTVLLEKDDSKKGKRIVTATAKVGGSERKIYTEFPAIAPDVFNNTVSTKGNILVNGEKSTLTVNSKVRVGGKVQDKSKHSTVMLEDKLEGVNSEAVSLTYPDVNQNGKPDEFRDFVEFNRKVLAKYPPEEVLYIKGSGNYTITPNKALAGKKIVYVEADEGDGNVDIQFSGAWEDEQNLTIISTGKVTYSQAATVGSNSQLNIIAWSGYLETAVLPGTHHGVIFTHGVAEFDEMHDTSITNGVLIANGGIEFKEVWSNKTFNYVDPRKAGAVPPGFEGLLGNGKSGYASAPNLWAEI